MPGLERRRPGAGHEAPLGRVYSQVTGSEL
jgi:hypothetical protein